MAIRNWVAGATMGWLAFASSSRAQLSFTDITDAAGVGGPSHFGGHGVEWADVDADGRPDMYVTMNRVPTDMAELFYRNVNGAQFAEQAAARGIANFDTGSHGGAWGDLDNDGDYDLINGAFVRNRVYENSGSGFFTDRTLASGFLTVNYGTRGNLLFDFDRDGDLDVFFNNWSAGNEPNEFYRNDGNLQFTSIDNGLGGVLGIQGTSEADFDNDGDLDLVLARGFGDDGPLILMRNTNGVFTQVPNPGFNVTAPRQEGGTWVDVDNDGWLDLHTMSGNTGGAGTCWLFINNRNGTFTQKSVPQGPGFMAGFEDLDNDGDWDMVYAGDNEVYLNDGSGNFAAAANFNPGPISDPRGIAFADIDDDGDMDFYCAQKLQFNRLIRNNLAGGGNWLKLRLISPNGQAGAFGAKVQLYEAGQAGNPAALICMREARSQEGYLGQNDPILHFGLGSRSSADVQVTMLDGTVATRPSVLANRTITIIEELEAPPIIAEVVPHPDEVLIGTAYQRQLALVSGTAPVSWSILEGPAGTQVSGGGLVSGWVPQAADLAQPATFTIQASNNAGDDIETWEVRVLSRSDLDHDGDSDQEDFAIFQRCLSGDGEVHAPGCAAADMDGDGDVDTLDFNIFLPCMSGPQHPPGC